MNTPFSSRLAIFFCRDAVNDDTRLIASVVLKMKLATGERNFLGRPRPRLIGAVSTIESICSGIDSIGGSIDDSIDEADNSSLA
jgi:hypothetical protein